MSFFKRLKREVWKVVRTFLLLGLVATVVITIVSYGKRANRPDHVALIIDADTGHGVDDLYAITRILIEPDPTSAKSDRLQEKRLKPEALLASQFNQSAGSNDSTMLISYLLNREIIRLHGLEDVMILPGAMENTGYSWKPEVHQSPASDFIIERTKKVPYGKKIDIVTLGAVTNLASALLTDSTLADRIRWYGFGLRFDQTDRIWNKNEFNVRNDLNALDFLLNLNNLETHIMPVNVARQVKFHRQDARDLLEGRGYKWDLLLDRFNATCPDCMQVDISSLMLIEAMLNPDLVTEKKFKTPPENSYRDIYVYTWIDGKKVLRDFRSAVSKDMGDG